MKRPIEDRGPGSHARKAFASLAAETGLSVEEIEEIAARPGGLQGLIDRNGLRERPRSEERCSPQQRLIEIQGKRWPAQPKSARERLLEVLARRWPDYEVTP
jgi:hypothetical protein